MKIVLIAALFLLVSEHSLAETVKCTDEKGKSIYQNWPCGTKPEIEKQAEKKPDYASIVDCSMKTTVTNMVDKKEKKNVLENCKN